MFNLRVLLREAEKALIQLNLVKTRIAEEYAKQVELAEGVNNIAKKRKVLAGLVIEEQKVVSNMDSFYQEKIFRDPAKKKKTAEDKEKVTRKTSPITRLSFWRQNTLDSCLRRKA